MKKVILWVAALVAVAGGVFVANSGTEAACLAGNPSCSENVTVQVEIQPGDICIGTTGSFDFGTYTSSATAQTVTGAFTDDFYVEDLNGGFSGYYTTLQLSGDLTSGDGNTIGASNVSVKTPATGAGAINTMAGTANTRVVVDAGMAAFQTLDSARTLIKRDSAANFGIVGQYGVMPEMQVVVPAYTPVGTYSATMVYTLYEN